jgi:hypothetical protein
MRLGGHYKRMKEYYSRLTWNLPPDIQVDGGHFCIPILLEAASCPAFLAFYETFPPPENTYEHCTFATANLTAIE